MPVPDPCYLPAEIPAAPMNIALIGIFDGSATDINRCVTNVPGRSVPSTWPAPACSTQSPSHPKSPASGSA